MNATLVPDGNPAAVRAPRTFEPDLLQTKHILVTGGGSGLGQSMAAGFLSLGAKVTICGRRVDVLESTACRLSALSRRGRVEFIACDLRDANAVEDMMDEIWRETPLDILVNNAAANFIARTDMLSHNGARAILDTSLHGSLHCTMAAGRRWIDGKYPGVVLSILSTSVFTGRAFTVPSAMAKAGLLAMTRSLAVEWGSRNIRTVAIAPGAFPTPGAMSRLHPDGRAAFVDGTPAGRVGDHGELADLASFLVSDRAGYITGEVVTIDGGRHLRSSGAEDLLGWSDDDWVRHEQSRGRSR